MQDVACIQATSDAFGKVGGSYVVLDAHVVEARFQKEYFSELGPINKHNGKDYCRLYPDSYSEQYLPPSGDVV